MVKVLRTCVGCGATRTVEEDDFWHEPAEPGDEFADLVNTHLADVQEHGQKELCEPCATKAEAAYTQRPTAGTLAEVLIQSYRRFLAAFAESMDPGIREALEVFPNLESLGGTPAASALKRVDAALENPLRRAGRDVAILFPPETEDDDPGHFIVYGLADEGEIGTSDMGIFEIVEQGIANAIDFAPDGTPLTK